MSEISHLKYASLHGHSDFSDGFDTVQHNVAQALKQGVAGLGITDHGTCAGLVSHWNECTQQGITPILGSEFYFRLPDYMEETTRNSASGRFHITLLSTNFDGYRRLIAANNDAHQNMETSKNGAKFPIANYDIFKEHFTQDGSIIFLTGCIASATFHDEIEIATDYVNELIKLVGKNNVYAELMPHVINMSRRGNDFMMDSFSRPLQLANTLDLKTVWSNDYHVAVPEHLPLLQAYTKTMKGYSFTADYIQSQDEAFKDAVKKIGKNEAIKAFTGIDEVLRRIEPVNLFNDFQLPEAKSEIEYVQTQSKERLEKDIETSGLDEQTLRERFQFEWDLLEEYNFWSYFGVLTDILRVGHEHEIKMISRGSASGSYIWYLLGGSQLHPVKHGLPFERFLARARLDAGELPDIDVDVAENKRHILQDYAKERWGFEPVGTILTYSHSSLVHVIERIIRTITQKQVVVPHKIAMAASEADPDDLDNSAEFQELLSYSRRVKGLPHDWALKLYHGLMGARSGYGRHACAVVPMMKNIPVPIEYFASEPVVAYTESGVNKVLQSCGLVKYDLLALKTLAVLQKMYELTGVDCPSEIEDGDPCFEMFRNIDISGVFQFDTRTGRSLLQLMKDNGQDINSIHTLSDLTSLGRPGPLKQDYHIVYAEQSADTSKHPEFIRQIFDRTRGVLIYQEQVYELFGRVAYADYNQTAKEMGIVAGKALVPKTVRLMNDPKFLKKYEETKQQFINGGIQYHGLEKNYLEELFDSLAGFIRYGFNLSHSLSYANLSAQTAWYKFHYPNEYWTVILSGLNYDTSDRMKLLQYITDASVSSGMSFNMPHVNNASLDFYLKDGKIFCPVSMVEGLGPTVAQQIVDNQPFDSLLDFANKVPSANKTLKMKMWQAGMFKGLSGTQIDLGVLESKTFNLKGKQWVEGYSEHLKKATILTREGNVIILDNEDTLKITTPSFNALNWAKENKINQTKPNHLTSGTTILYYAHDGYLLANKRLSYLQPEHEVLPINQGIKAAIGFYIPNNLAEIIRHVEQYPKQRLGYVVNVRYRTTAKGTQQIKVLLHTGESVWFFMGSDSPKTKRFLISKTFRGTDEEKERSFAAYQRLAHEIQEGDLLWCELVYDKDEDGNTRTFKQVRNAKIYT